MKNRKLAVGLIVAGIATNVIDTFSDGALFGPEGALKVINDPLPKVNIPGTSIPLNVAGWVTVAGLALLLVQALRK